MRSNTALLRARGQGRGQDRRVRCRWRASPVVPVSLPVFSRCAPASFPVCAHCSCCPAPRWKEPRNCVQSSRQRSLFDRFDPCVLRWFFCGCSPLDAGYRQPRAAGGPGETTKHHYLARGNPTRTTQTQKSDPEPTFPNVAVNLGPTQPITRPLRRRFPETLAWSPT
jgi:hypothetical protein